MLRSAEKVPEKNTPRKVKSGSGGGENSLGVMARQRLSVPDLETVLASSTASAGAGGDKKKKGIFSLGSKPRIKKALEKMNIIPKMNG